MSKCDKPQHLHLAYFGSELACPICNPLCYKNHGMDKIDWCGHPRCPMNPNKFKQSNVTNHEHKVCETQKRSILKGITAKAIEVTVDTFVVNYFIQKPVDSFGIALGLEVFCYISGYFNERLWDRLQWGRKVIDVISRD